MAAETVNDRYKLHQFYQGVEKPNTYVPVQEITEKVFQVKDLKIVTLAMDLPGKTPKYRKQLEAEWITTLPQLDNVRSLSVRHRVTQEYFEAICNMKNLDRLHFWTSTAENLTSIAKLQKLTRLTLSSFSRVSDISPLLMLKKLTHLSIENSFKIENYEIIGEMKGLIGLSLSGDFTSPKNLRLKSLKPFVTLKNLKHLDLSFCSVIDQSYEAILQMPSLERLDTTANMPKALREKIKAEHPNLKAGLFMDWDFENKRLYDGKVW
jgi:hypothetical protein